MKPLDFQEFTTHSLRLKWFNFIKRYVILKGSYIGSNLGSPYQYKKPSVGDETWENIGETCEACIFDMP